MGLKSTVGGAWVGQIGHSVVVLHSGKHFLFPLFSKDIMEDLWVILLDGIKKNCELINRSIINLIDDSWNHESVIILLFVARFVVFCLISIVF